MDFKRILRKADAHFKKMKDRIPLFLTPPRNMEGWFSGEMAVVLERCKKADIISEWWPEVRYSWNKEKGKKVCDYVLQIKDSPHLVGLEIKTAFAARQGKRWLSNDEDGVLMLHDEDEKDKTLWKLQGAYYYGAVKEDARRLCEEGGLSGRYCLVFAYGTNEELNDTCIDKFKEKLIEYCASNEDSVHERKIEACGQTVLHILSFRVSSPG
jgi:hypothetical protein